MLVDLVVVEHVLDVARRHNRFRNREFLENFKEFLVTHETLIQTVGGEYMRF